MNKYSNNGVISWLFKSFQIIQNTLSAITCWFWSCKSKDERDKTPAFNTLSDDSHLLTTHLKYLEIVLNTNTWPFSSPEQLSQNLGDCDLPGISSFYNTPADPNYSGGWEPHTATVVEERNKTRLTEEMCLDHLE